MAGKKTCGTCAYYYVVRPTMKQGACLMDELDEHGCAPLHDLHEEACENWEPKPLTAEERCHQLEQLAREMWEYVKPFELPAFGCEDLSGLRSRLEALGVSVDG